MADEYGDETETKTQPQTRTQSLIHGPTPTKLGMVDVSGKTPSNRVAVAVATIRLGARAFDALLKKKSPKGDVLETAKIAGIINAKATSSIIPLCHPLEISHVNITFEELKASKSIQVKSEVGYTGRTGVEMEALVAAATAALTIYDMMKWADKGMIISEVKLLKKSGGKSGNYARN